jgi:GDP-L-fucose synthase
MSNFTLMGKKIWVAGHRGMVGSAIVRQLAHENCEIITASRDILDLKDQSQTHTWMKRNRPDVVFIAAARVGGILANNTYPADFIYDNLVIQTNIIEGAYRSDVSKLIFLGSSCIYPRLAPQPICEDSLLTSSLEPTNQWYAVAKIAGIKLCQAYRLQYGCDFISAMPTNLYGQGDNFNLSTSHVIPALLRKAHEAKLSGAAQMTVWGTGKPYREFLHVDDCADAVLFLAKNYSGEEHVNVGSGNEIAIDELATLIAQTVGFEGEVVYDTSRPDGTPRKLMSAEKLRALGWVPKIDLRYGLQATYRWFLDNSNRFKQ